MPQPQFIIYTSEPISEEKVRMIVEAVRKDRIEAIFSYSEDFTNRTGIALTPEQSIHIFDTIQNGIQRLRYCMKWKKDKMEHPWAFRNNKNLGTDN
jgi:hypothetical protein